MKRIRDLAGATLVLLGLAFVPCQAQLIPEWVTVGDPGNLPDESGFGAVSEVFRISKYEVTNREYAVFLNAVAVDDPFELYSPKMDVNTDSRGGIVRSGEPGSYAYAAQPGREHKPVVWVSFWDSVRFVNWLQNGQPSGPQSATTTEDGAYTLTAEGIANNRVLRNPGATVYLPSEDQWYKSAYYKGGGSDAGYWLYPTSTSEATVAEVPPGGGSHSANIEEVIGNVTDVGAYTTTTSPFGAFDQDGNAWEWNETIFTDLANDSFRLIRGGSWNDNFRHSQSSVAFYLDPSFENLNLGFRIASVPEPGTVMLGLLGVLGLLHSQRLRKIQLRLRT